MLKSFVFLFFIIYLIGAIVSIFIFIIDTFRWHKREEHIKIIPSAQLGESEVIQNERRDNGRAPGRGDNNDNGSSGREPDGDRDNNNNDNFF